MCPTTGGIETIKDALITLIAASSTLLSTTNVVGDQDKVESFLMADNLPFITVRLTQSRQLDVYGRATPSTGHFIVYPFTLHLFHSASRETGEAREQYAHDVADEIIDYLDSNRASLGSNIQDCFDLRFRDAQVANASPELIRVIINGSLLVLRED